MKIFYLVEGFKTLKGGRAIAEGVEFSRGGCVVYFLDSGTTRLSRSLEEVETMYCTDGILLVDRGPFQCEFTTSAVKVAE